MTVVLVLGVLGVWTALALRLAALWLALALAPAGVAAIPEEAELEITGAALWDGAAVECWGAAWGAGSGEGPPPEPAEG